MITPKGLRHLHASFLINELNVNPLVVQKRLGYSDIQITLGVYAHLYPTIDSEIANQMNGKIKIQTSGNSLLNNWNGNQYINRSNESNLEDEK
ncbi:tyrosine-type recombinase/integrase [Oceanobacillus massiliensis]|uniref:tyrosine-type recombinase/integrase n=1 Tax=Oceanobacillus massiliensis TaxID=1465765 RepID=UPI00028973F3|nr:tyrosine-type recombinase/integrase [Oceanobacillus massiliensis]